MARYLFNYPRRGAVAEPIEMDLPDFASLRREVLETACRVLHEQGDRYWRPREWLMIVTDGGGLMLFTLHFHPTVAPAARGQFAGHGE